MKTMKRIVALLICFVMVMGMTVTAFADDTTQMYIIAAPKTDHQYEIYQIFTGTCSRDVLSNVKWGKNGRGTEGKAVNADVLTALTKVNSETYLEKLNEIKKHVNLSSIPVATITKGETYKAVAGYYLIKDKDASLIDETSGVGKNDAYTTYIVKVVGDVNIQTKSNIPEMTKKVKDKDDTTGSESIWQDSADYDLDDKIPFKLEGTVATNYDDYEHYYFAFHDKEEAGLKFNENSVKVYLNDSTDAIDPSKYEVKTTELTDDCTFEVIFMDLKSISEVSASTRIRVEYTATLTTEAAIGKKGNVNTAKLEYSNNPNNTGEGTKKPDDTGNTPWDNVIVFTYKVVVNKVDSSNKELIGAAFKLEKVVKNENDDNITKLIKEYTINSDVKISEFEFTGLDDGTYILTETKTPAGYNSIDPITFTVTADHNIEWDKQGRYDILTSLSAKQADNSITFSEDDNDNKGTLTTNVVNQSGSTLPSTGGIGTRIFYIIGGILMAAAAVVLITKARYKKEK